VRMPAALAACGCVLLMFAWGFARGRPLAGFIAALMLATALHFTTLARTGRIDMPLTLTVALSLVSFVQGYQRRQSQGRRAGWGWFLVGYLAIAAGVMLKGPIAVVLPLTVGVAWWVIACRKDGIRSIARYDLHWGIPLVLMLTVPWYWWANWQTDGEWFRVFFWFHNVERGLGTEDKLRAYPFWFYGPQLLRDLLPWSLLLPLGLIHVWRNRGDKDACFGAVWLMAMVLLLSCMRFKRADYLLPAFPGATWMLGCAAESWYRQNPGRRLVVAGFSTIIALIVGLWLGYIAMVIPGLEETRTHRRFAEEVRRHTADKVFFFQAEAHNVAFRLGPPVRTLLEWENLDVWAAKPQSIHVVMSPECAKEWRQHLKAGTLEVLATSEGLARPAPGILSWLRDLDESVLDNHERPLVLLRTHCLPKS
jgi:4-amino-4-deoxy-L-arabinose transferase-like glycosyltransferase